MEATTCKSPSAASRIACAEEWLGRNGHTHELVLIGATTESISRLVRGRVLAQRGCFGWHRFTFTRFAVQLASQALAASGLALAGQVAIEAVCARLAHELGASGRLGRFAPIGDQPGFPRALSRTLTELRLARADPEAMRDQDMAQLLRAFSDLLERLKLADRASLLALATTSLQSSSTICKHPTLFLDVPIATASEREFLRGILMHSPSVCITLPAGDVDTSANLHALGLDINDIEAREGRIAPVLRSLFVEDAPVASVGDAVELFSAPGESRECVEIARRVLREAERGVPFDDMAVVLRAPERYRAPLEEAFARAKVPVHFARGSRRPNPAGRAFLALLMCKVEDLSASRFAEYLSLGVVPDATEAGASPATVPSQERWAAPEHEFSPELTEDDSEERDDDEPLPVVDPDTVPVVAGTLRAPRAWERLVVDAAVIGGRERWGKRLAGLRAELELDYAECEDPEDPVALRLTRELRDLDSLRKYALPLIEELAALPELAPWGAWLDRLSGLAARALRHPESVLRALSELAPMDSVGPVDVHEVRLVLERRLLETVNPPAQRSYGRVYVASTEEIRGLQFEVVFVPGLAEKVFPQKLTEDPLLPDASPTRTELGLRTRSERAALERLALRLALGASRERVVVSYPGIDLEQSRPRTASFYALEVLRAAEGVLLGFDELSLRANISAEARIGWPAPSTSQKAIDDAEHDLAVLDGVRHRTRAETMGSARYLVSANPHLARALRSRWFRWSSRWTAADGLVEPDERAQAALSAHGLDRRSFSATALQNFAACPYRFLLQAVHRLTPRVEPAPIERLDPLQRGSLIHEVQFVLLNRLRDRRALPVTGQSLTAAQELLDGVITEVAGRYAEELRPAIERVWLDSIAEIRADLREWLRRMSEDVRWRPTHFELSFELKQRRAHDPNSVPNPVVLDCGIRLRGSIDLVETSDTGSLRATDYKTGKVRATAGMVIDGGNTLQPVLYALALERLMPHVQVESGRLYYCTHTGEFESVTIPLDDSAREAARLAADTIGSALVQGFLPAAPIDGACRYCDYQRVCGPHEEARTRRKKREPLVQLLALRGVR